MQSISTMRISGIGNGFVVLELRQSGYDGETYQENSKMAEEKSGNRSGGVNISGGNVNVGGDIVGRDKITGTQISRNQLDAIFRPLEEAVGQQPEAAEKVEALKNEAAKGKKADDGVMAKLVKGIAGLVSGVASAVVNAFATPILGAMAGPVTKYVLDEIQGK
jgi:hypothetical protein